MQYLIVTMSPKEHKRIFKKISIDNKTKCWNWIGSFDQSGYGLLWYKGKTERIHRIIYSFFVNPVPKNNRKLTIDHLCRNHACCNPNHLELIKHRLNVLRGIGPSAINAKKERCKYGHQLSKYKEFKRICKKCDSIRHKKRMKGPKRDYWLKKAKEASEKYRNKNNNR